MATVVIDEQGSEVHYKGNQVIITAKDDSLTWSIPKAKVERLLIVGRTTLTQSAIDFLLGNSIPTHFITLSGSYKGQLSGIDGKNVFVRMKQYERYQNPSYRNELARIIVRQKVNSLRYFLAKHNRYHKKPELDDTTTRMKAMLQNLPNSTTTDEIRGVEGACAAAYFAAFGSTFAEKPFQFEKRSRRPPLDPINAMLSLGYTLLLSEVISAVTATGLDPYVGFLHSADYGRPSLACDLQEEFRYIIDELVVRVINLGQIKPDDFETQEDGAVMMNEPTRDIYYRAYERKMREGAQYKGQKTTYRRIIQRQAQHLAKSLFDKDPSYEPFVRPQG